MVKFDPQKHHRRSIRLKEYDYSTAGAYFVTIVAWQRQFLFGEIINGAMRFSRYGEIVQKWWNEIPGHFPNVETGAFVIMPIHIHGIILIIDKRRGTVFVPKDNTFPHPQAGVTLPLRLPTLGQIIAYFKYQSTKEMNLLGNSATVTRFWQRNYEHVIRNDTDLQNKTDYIHANPLLWKEDDENPVNAHKRSAA